LVLFARWIVRDVEELIVEVVGVSYAMVVVSGVPDFSLGLLAYCKGVSALEVLDALCCRLVYAWRDKDVRVVGHDDEAVELEAVFCLMLEERLDEEFGVRCALEMAVSLEGQYGDGVGALLLTDGGHAEESIPQGLKPLFIRAWWRAKPEGLAYLEAVRAFRANAHILMRVNRPSACG
jgi:hypothetical protein